MHRILTLVVVVTLTLGTALAPRTAHADARLTAVRALGNGCVSGPTGNNTEQWDIAPGDTYRVRIEGATDVGNGGTATSINVLVMNSAYGNRAFVANNVGLGIYEFDVPMSSNSCNTSPIRYGTAGGNTPNTGKFVTRHDGGSAQAHLRASAFNPGCKSPNPIICLFTPTAQSTWGALKSFYR